MPAAEPHDRKASCGPLGKRRMSQPSTISSNILAARTSPREADSRFSIWSSVPFFSRCRCMCVEREASCVTTQTEEEQRIAAQSRPPGCAQRAYPLPRPAGSTLPPARLRHRSTYIATRAAFTVQRACARRHWQRTLPLPPRFSEGAWLLRKRQGMRLHRSPLLSRRVAPQDHGQREGEQDRHATQRR